MAITNQMMEETADAPGDGNQGKALALGKTKENHAKALGHEKAPIDKDK